MPRYIDADKLMKDIRQRAYLTDNIVERPIYAMTVLGIQQTVDEQPIISTDEVRGVVHCKDCKWCHAGYCEKYDDLIPWGCANKPWEDWFCADGAKMEVAE